MYNTYTDINIVEILEQTLFFITLNLQVNVPKSDLSTVSIFSNMCMII